MGVEGCCACVKYLLFFLNFLFFLGGLGSAGLGIYSLIHTKGDIGEVIGNKEGTFGGLLTAVGILSCFLSAAGCLGAARENRCALLTYAIALSTIFLMEAVGGGVGYHYRHKLRDIVDKGMLKTLNSYEPAELNDVVLAWSRVQTLFTCCGVDSPADWLSNSSKWGQHFHNGTYPVSCCSEPTVIQCTNTTGMGFHESGCLQKVVQSLTKQWGIWAGTAIGIAVIQVFGIICACALQHNIKRMDYSVV